MREYLPLLIVGAIIGTFSLCFVVAYALMKNKKEAIGFDRNMKDSEIILRLLKYARPHLKAFIAVFFIMLISIAYDLVSPLIVGYIEEMIKTEFELTSLFISVAGYACILIVSMISTYVQSILLQKTGQKILSAMREDIFTHIEGLSHDQLHQMPVGKLVTRVTNDTNAISMMFTNTLVTMVKNFFVIIGIL